MKIYLGKDGRRRVWKTYPDGTKKVTTYARHLVEEKLGRPLTEDETVDHRDRNKQNDNISNLQILSWERHKQKDTKYVKEIEITCILCGTKKKKQPKDVNHNARLGKAGPFCGRSCAGKYGAEIQNKRREKLPSQPIIPIKEREYFYLEKRAEMM